MRSIRLILLWLLVPLLLQAQGNPAVSEEKVEAALLRQFEIYPKSRLADIYKFFFQDKFGPGHLLADTAKAGAYIRYELSQMPADGSSLCPDIDTIGWENSFVRVNLALVKRGVLTYRELFDAFVASMHPQLPDVSGWASEWAAILKVASRIRVRMDGDGIVPDKNGVPLAQTLPDFEKDRQAIEQELKKGNYVGHHSDLFGKTYDPHYRLVSKKIYTQIRK